LENCDRLPTEPGESTAPCINPGLRQSPDGEWRYYTSATNPGEHPTPNGIRVIREVAKLEHRLDDLGMSNNDFENRLLRFFMKSFSHHAKTLLMGDPLGAIDWWEPDHEALVEAEQYQIWQKLSEIRTWSGVETTWWEVGNEPNLWPPITPKEYANIFSSYYNTIKANPQGSEFAQVGVSIHSNNFLYSAKEMISLSMSQRIQAYQDIIDNAALIGAGTGLVLGGGIGLVTVEPTTALAIAAVTAVIGGIAGKVIEEAFDKAVRDTKNALSSKISYNNLPQATTNWFTDFIQELPDDTPPDFIGYHTYFLLLNSRPDLNTITQTINSDILEMQLAWVEKFAPQDLPAIQAITQQNPLANLTAITVQTSIGPKNIPPVFITEFGNILPPQTVAEWHHIPQPEYFFLTDENGVSLQTKARSQYFRIPPESGTCPSNVMPPAPTNQDLIFYFSTKDSFEVEACYVELASDLEVSPSSLFPPFIANHENTNNPFDILALMAGAKYNIVGFMNKNKNTTLPPTDIYYLPIYNTPTHIVNEYIAPLVHNYINNPNIHLWLYYKAQGEDAKFAQFGMEAATVRLFTDDDYKPFNPRKERPDLYGSQYGFAEIDWFACEDLNAIGQWFYRERFGTECPTGTNIMAKKATSYFADGTWSSPQAPLSPSTPNTQVRPLVAPKVLTVQGSGWRELQRTFSTADLLPTGATQYMAIDLYIPQSQENPWWAGEVQLSLHMPSQGLYNYWVGRQDLNAYASGQWNRVVFTLDTNVLSKLQGDFGDLSIRIALNGPQEFHLDNLHFYTNSPAAIVPQRPNETILGFENILNWECVQCQYLEQEPHLRTQGSASLQVYSANWNELKSATFGLPSQASQAEQNMTVDFYVPTSQNPWWSGTLAASMDCPQANVFSAWMGQHELTPLPKNQWHTLSFTVPAIQAPNAVPTGCQIRLMLNVPTEPQSYYLDNIQFQERL
jgi:hypothetical protein